MFLYNSVAPFGNAFGAVFANPPPFFQVKPVFGKSFRFDAMPKCRLPGVQIQNTPNRQTHFEHNTKTVFDLFFYLCLFGKIPHKF